MQSNFPITGPLGLGDLLDRAFRLYRARFGVFVLIAAIFLIPFGIVSGIVTGDYMLNSFQMLRAMMTNPSAFPATSAQMPVEDGQVGLIILMGTIGGFVINGIVMLALTTQAIATLHGEQQPLGQSIRRGVGRFWAYLGMYLLRGLGLFAAYIGGAILVGCAAFAIAFTLVGGATAFGTSEPPLGSTALAGMVVLGACLYGVAIALVATPVLYLFARWIVVTPCLVEQRQGPIRALGASWRLTKGNVRRVLFYALLLGILYLVIFFGIAFTVQWSLFAIFSFMPVVAGALSGAVSGLLGVFWQPLFVAAIVLLYYDLRVRHEGYDLAQRIENMASTVTAHAALTGAEERPR